MFGKKMIFKLTVTIFFASIFQKITFKTNDLIN